MGGLVGIGRRGHDETRQGRDNGVACGAYLGWLGQRQLLFQSGLDF